MFKEIQLIENRIKDLEEMIYKSRNGRGYSDVKWLESLLDLNQKMLAVMMKGYPPVFHKIQYIDPQAKGFFLTKADIVEPFMSVWN